jgi:hypothetical protein
MSKILSIITVNKDSAEDLLRTINSLIPILSWDKLEYIIIDGDSSDSSISVINGFNRYITKYVSEPDEGIYDAMNKGILLSSGQWLWFLNSGDQSKINLTDLKNIFLNINSRVNFLYSNFFITDKLVINQELGRIALIRGMINHQSIFYKRSLFGGFDCSFKLAADFAHLLNNYSLINAEKIPYPISQYNLYGVSSLLTKKARIEVWYYRMLAFSKSNINIFYKIFGILFCLCVCFLKFINPKFGSNILKLRKELEKL